MLQTSASILSEPVFIRPSHETRNKPLTLVVIGTGHVGSALLNQLAEARQPWIRELRVAVIANRRHLISKPGGIGLGTWRDHLTSNVRRGGDELIQSISELRRSNTV